MRTTKQANLDFTEFKNQLKKMPISVFHNEMRKIGELVKRNPKDWQLLFANALMCRHSSSFHEAIKLLKKADKLNPGSEQIYRELAEITFLELRNYQDALRIFRKWSLKKPGNLSVKAKSADCLIYLQRYDEAFEVLNRMEEIEPGFPEIHTKRAEVYSKTGNASAARASLEDAFSFSGDLETLSKVVALPNYTADEEQLDNIYESSIEQDEIKNSSLHFSNLGKAYEKIEKYDKAFACFERSNLVPLKYLNKNDELAAFRNLKETFTKPFLATRKGLGHDSSSPVFIVGMPRSGTTLTESILSGHRNIIGNGELVYLYSFLRKNGLNSHVNPLLSETTHSLQKFLHEAPETYFRIIADGYLSDSGFDNGSSKFQVDKLPHNFMSIGLIHLIFPNAKIIHCRRHPIDCALSCYKTSFNEYQAYASELEFLGIYYRQYWELMKYWRDLLPGKLIEVYYEDLVADTERIARALIDQMGLDWDASCLDHTSSKTTVDTASNWQVRQPIYRSSVSSWKNYENHLAPLIKTLGTCVDEYETQLSNAFA